MTMLLIDFIWCCRGQIKSWNNDANNQPDDDDDDDDKSEDREISI